MTSVAVALFRLLDSDLQKVGKRLCQHNLPVTLKFNALKATQKMKTLLKYVQDRHGQRSVCNVLLYLD